MKHQDFMDVGAAPDKTALERSLIQFARELEFDLVSAVLIVRRPGGASSFVERIGNTPTAFLEASLNEVDSKRDPVLQKMLRVSTPFVYDQSTYVTAGAGDLWESQAAFGYRSGVSVALHAGAGRHFLLGIDRDKDLPSDEEIIGRLLADVQLLAVFAQDAAARVLVPDEEATLVPKLTQRQLEVLRWAKNGKTLEMTAQILGISVNTVDYHLRCIRDRLGVADTRQAIVKGLDIGLI